MTRFGWLPVLFASACILQGQEFPSHGYWYAAPGAVAREGLSSATVHLGGGYERSIARGFGVAIEGGALAVAKEFRDSLQGTGSLNGSYHVLAGRLGNIDPFVSAGYSLFFRRGTVNAANYGGGMNYWFRPNLGWKVEFRDHYQPSTGLHWWGVRFGLAFTELLP